MRYPLKAELKERIWAFLGRAREWDARGGAPGHPDIP
jgi:hypothetical protein